MKRCRVRACLCLRRCGSALLRGGVRSQSKRHRDGGRLRRHATGVRPFFGAWWGRPSVSLQEASRAHASAIIGLCPGCEHLYTTLKLRKRHWKRGVLAGRFSAQACGPQFRMFAGSRAQYPCRLCGLALGELWRPHVACALPRPPFRGVNDTEQVIDLAECERRRRVCHVQAGDHGTSGPRSERDASRMVERAPCRPRQRGRRREAGAWEVGATTTARWQGCWPCAGPVDT